MSGSDIIGQGWSFPIKVNAKVNDEALFLLELVYGAVVTIRNTPRDMLPPILLVETPRLMFPFARNIVADATRDGGFPPLMINPVDFVELYRRRIADFDPNNTQPAADA